MMLLPFPLPGLEPITPNLDVAVVPTMGLAIASSSWLKLALLEEAGDNEIGEECAPPILICANLWSKLLLTGESYSCFKKLGNKGLTPVFRLGTFEASEAAAKVDNESGGRKVEASNPSTDAGTGVCARLLADGTGIGAEVGVW